ncbi:MAG TPA: hypothetical protein DIW47_07235 [Bacteroidetes bacterium]|nr:hypothetical protein [Bacteroidota bacterium]
MSSAGTVADMIVRVRNNQNLIGKQKRYFEIMKTYSKTGLNKKLEWNSLSDEERAFLIAKLEQNLKSERKKDWIAVGISILVTGMIILLLAALFRWVFM